MDNDSDPDEGDEADIDEGGRNSKPKVAAIDRAGKELPGYLRPAASSKMRTFMSPGKSEKMMASLDSLSKTMAAPQSDPLDEMR